MSLSDRAPEYLLGKYELMVTVTFTALFSIVFVLLSIPFSHNYWFDIRTSLSFGFTVAFFLLSVGVVVFSKMLMYKMRTSLDFSFANYIGWNLAEVLIITVMYTFFTTEGHEYGIIDMGKQTFLELFLGSFVFILACLGIPYVIVGLYLALHEKNNIIRVMNMNNVEGDHYDSHVEDKRITLFDNTGVLRFSIKQDNLYFIESDDNYIQVWYMDRTGEMKQYMLRCRLKTVEESFRDSELCRCHRKYIVNISKIKILKAEKEGYMIDLDIDAIEPIPISKTYEKEVLSRFNSR